MSRLADLLRAIADGHRPSGLEALSLFDRAPTEHLVAVAGRIRDRGHGDIVSYSPKVFIPLTRLCRDVCHYCTFARPPRREERPYLDLDEVLAIARAGARAGCREALFTLGDRPESRHRAAREALARLGHATTLSYLVEAAGAVLAETGLLPHANPGVMEADEIAALRRVTVSQGLMLESASPRLCRKGGPHHGSPDKDPGLRLRTIRRAGEQAVPFTSGILIGIGEAPRDRVLALLALRAANDRHGHLQEIIVQNFRAKPATPMARDPEPDPEAMARTVAIARIVFGPAMNIQAPPNLNPDHLPGLVAAGINDWGGISPVTPDHVNPEAPWPELRTLAQATAASGKTLVERLAIYPAQARQAERWVDPAIRRHLLAAMDGDGFARADPWVPGLVDEPMPRQAVVFGQTRDRDADRALDQAVAGRALTESQIAHLFRARGGTTSAVLAAADALRRDAVGDVVTYVVNRNINYTNVCSFACGFCAFSKGRPGEHGRERPYVVDYEEVARRAAEAWERGATEVCLQGGIHPSFTGETYLEICRRVKEAVPAIHLHAFSPLEVWHGAATSGLSVERFLGRLRDAGLGTLPGTAAEVLDDEVRRFLCPDKLTTDQWLTVMRTAHRLGLHSTATVMFGHVDRYEHWARHLLRVRWLQEDTGGFTEFVPLPFVPMEAPIYRRGQSRRGPTAREAMLMHAVARLSLAPVISNIQTSWVKLGPHGAASCLDAGANDLGGTLMNESITRSAGARHGQEMPPARLEALIRRSGRLPRQRTTAYGVVDADRTLRSMAPPPLDPEVRRAAKTVPRGQETLNFRGP